MRRKGEEDSYDFFPGRKATGRTAIASYKDSFSAGSAVNVPGPLSNRQLLEVLMENLKNMGRSAVICAVVSGIYTFYVASTVFKSQFSVEGQEMGRVGAFIIAAQTTPDFWSHVASGWVAGFGVSMVSCILLLVWLSSKAFGKKRNADSGAQAPPPVH